MQTRIIVTLVTTIGLVAGIGWYVGAQESSSLGLETFSPGQVLTAESLNTNFSLLEQAIPSNDALIREVDCSNGETITAALTQAKPGDTIRISGTCNETVAITTDRLTLEGDNAVIDGEDVDLGNESGLLIIDGTRGVVITGTLMVKNSSAVGITVRNNASASFRGSIESRDHGNHGILVINSAHVGFDEGSVAVIDNGGDGVPVVNGSSAFIPPPPAGAVLTSNGNRRGIHLINGGSFEALGGAINAAGNQLNGIRAALGSDLFMAAGAQVSLQDNPQGLNIESNSQALISSPTTITGNDVVGVSVQAGFIDLRGATVTGNGPADAGLDVDLSFGARANLTGNTLDALRCDETVLLSLGTDTECPTL